MDVLIESTRSFEKDFGKLSKEEKDAAIKKINDCASLFPTQKADVYRELHRLPLALDLNGYEASLYILKVSQKLRVIVAVDEDPIFDQGIFTLFRAVKHSDLDKPYSDLINKAYKDVAESLYQDLLHQDRKTARIS